MIDIGVNLLHPQFEGDRELVVDRAAAVGITGMLLTATDLQTAAATIDFCASSERQAIQMRTTAGVHPHDAKDAPENLADLLRTLAGSPEVRAIGETGLDFNRNFSPPDLQISVFETQLRLAADLALPVFAHDRDSDGQVYRLLKKYAHLLPGMVVHCFTGSAADLDRYLDLGCAIGITGWVCDRRRGETLRGIVSRIPLDRLMIETDAPFLLPQNAPPDWYQHNAGIRRRNEPALLPWVAAGIAEATGRLLQEIREGTAANARRLFGLD